MNKKQFSTIISILIIATVPLYSAQKTFMEKWIVEPSSAILKSKKAWAFAVGAALCYAARKGYNSVVQKVQRVEDRVAQVLDNKNRLIPTSFKVRGIHISTHLARTINKNLQVQSAITEYVINELLTDKTTQPICSCYDASLEPAQRVVTMLTNRLRILKGLHDKLTRGNPLVRLWHWVKNDNSVTKLENEQKRVQALIDLLSKDDIQQRINQGSTYCGEHNKECTSPYCIKLRTYSTQS